MWLKIRETPIQKRLEGFFKRWIRNEELQDKIYLSETDHLISIKIIWGDAEYNNDGEATVEYTIAD